ncbi:MAG: putative metal-binding protein [Gemmatimonadota bacterium]
MVKPAAADLLVERPAAPVRVAGTVEDIVPASLGPREEDVFGQAVAPVGAPSIRNDTDLAAQAAAALAASALFASMEIPAPNTAAAQRRHATVQFVDPAVSRVKFDREVAAFRRYEEVYRARGTVLINATFPKVTIMQCVPQLRPPAVLFGAVIDYTNFDAEPPSVSIFDPFTGRPLRMKEVFWPLPRRARAAAVDAPSSDHTPKPSSPSGQSDAVPQQIELAFVLQAWGPDDIPFMCVPGVREYHEHPGHSGDSWFRHRTAGAGRLDAILNIFHTYGTAPIVEYGVNVAFHPLPDGTTQVQAKVSGFACKELPL